MDDLYRDELLEHYKHPRNYGKIEDAEVKVLEKNAGCGDLIWVWVKKVREGDWIKFTGQGCAVSVAFTSMLIEQIKENRLTDEQVLKMGDEELLAVAGLGEISPARRKCALLGLKAVKRALSKSRVKVRNSGERELAASRCLGITEAVKVLKRGGVVCLPTDTVWGVGAWVSSRVGVEKLYRVKRREATKPTAILVTDIHMARRYGEIEGRAYDLAARYWPGAVTLVVPARKENVPLLVRGGGEKVGLRVPDHRVTIELIEKLGGGVVAASANRAGEPAPGKFEEVEVKLLAEVDGYLEGKAGGKSASTVVDLVEDRVLRDGDVRISSQ